MILPSAFREMLRMYYTAMIQGELEILRAFSEQRELATQYTDKVLERYEDGY